MKVAIPRNPPLMASEGKSEDKETFVIRRAKLLDDLQWVIKLATEDGWLPRKKEAECYFLAGLTPYFFIGELNGKRIGCVSIVRHGESAAAGGYHLVAKPYRGKRYGKDLFRFSQAFGGQSNVNILFWIPTTKLNFYQQIGSYKPGWVMRIYKLTASRAVEGLATSQLSPSDALILPASKADFEKLFAYGANMMGTSQTCKLLLAAWLSHLQESSWVAIDNLSEVVGYLILSETTGFPEDGYRIAPLYADSASIALSLLRVAIGFASATNPKHNIEIYIPVDHNPEGVGLLEDIGAQPAMDQTFMATKTLPVANKCLSKVFGIACDQIM